jgi:hypothetical protein
MTAEKVVEKKAKRQGVTHLGHVRVHENSKREDCAFFNVADGGTHGMGSKPNCNVGGQPLISDSLQQMKGIGDHDGAFWIVDSRGLRRHLCAPSFVEFRVKDIGIESPSKQTLQHENRAAESECSSVVAAFL